MAIGQPADALNAVTTLLRDAAGRPLTLRIMSGEKYREEAGGPNESDSCRYATRPTSGRATRTTRRLFA